MNLNMRIKQWAVALLFGSLILGTTSCAKEEQGPQEPVTCVFPDILAGVWNLSDVAVSPETITVDGTEYKVADHIFKASIFNGLTVAPSKLKIVGETTGEKATLISVVDDVEKTFEVALKDGKLSVHNFPFGSVARKDGQLKLEIDVTNDLLKKMPATHFGNSEAGIILKALADQNLDLKITATGTK